MLSLGSGLQTAQAPEAPLAAPRRATHPSGRLKCSLPLGLAHLCSVRLLLLRRRRRGRRALRLLRLLRQQRLVSRALWLLRLLGCSSGYGSCCTGLEGLHPLQRPSWRAAATVGAPRGTCTRAHSGLHLPSARSHAFQCCVATASALLLRAAAEADFLCAGKHQL